MHTGLLHRGVGGAGGDSIFFLSCFCDSFERGELGFKGSKRLYCFTVVSFCSFFFLFFFPPSIGDWRGVDWCQIQIVKKVVQKRSFLMANEILCQFEP